ncbi:hypothetical protein EDC96DRAFT_348164 [Choanephora cucurbitarum]|nr:hypothetical protein EDC96DRAFT_348164 [Choanephora cucurbitarum]
MHYHSCVLLRLCVSFYDFICCGLVGYRCYTIAYTFSNQLNMLSSNPVDCLLLCAILSQFGTREYCVVTFFLSIVSFACLEQRYLCQE